MYSLTVSDHIMIAHSFAGPIFGQAQRVHGATFVVEWEIRRAALDADGLIADIGLMRTTLRTTLDTIDYRNLDDEARFKGRNTTTEFLSAGCSNASRNASTPNSTGFLRADLAPARR